MLPDAAGIVSRVSFGIWTDLVLGLGVTYEAGVLQACHHLGGQGGCLVRVGSRGGGLIGEGGIE